ncbi:MAG: hypothetical protein K2J77_07515 [Oscillospiraceae bacterium]|nr:hypothetical protein [Oscillospiraceae bacterium]
MKHKIIAPLLACIALLCGCNKNNSLTSGTTSIIGEESRGAQQFADFVGEYPENPISVLTLSEDEIRQAINAQSNFSCTENLWVNIPESASVYEFNTYGVHVPQFDYPAAQYKKDFEALFSYLFPGREIDPNCLKYSKYLGYDYEKQDYIFDEGYVRDNEKLPDGVNFIYDGDVYLETNSEIGVGSGLVNKGEAAKIAFNDAPDTLSYFEPGDYFESVGIYSPQSEKSFPLLDGEMRICDAVAFFEDYVNNAPISTGLQRNIRTRVYNVEVLKVNDKYGYYFTTVAEFRGVGYEPVIYGTVSEYSYDPTRGEAFMIRRGDIDYIHCFYGSEWTFDVKPRGEIVPVETAIKNISGKLTAAVTFDVISIEFVYVRQFVKDEQGHINIDTYEAKITPAWRITAGNSNDNHTYMCYVDAVDGDNFRFYTTPGIVSFSRSAEDA